MSDHTLSTLLEFAWDPHQVGLNQSKVCAVNVHKELKQEYVLLNSNGIPTLAGRRKQLKLCSLFQMMNGQISFPSAPHVRRPALNLRNSNPHHLVQPAVHSNAHQFSFFPHAISLWNQLPNSVYDFETLLSFKH